MGLVEQEPRNNGFTTTFIVLPLERVLATKGVSQDQPWVNLTTSPQGPTGERSNFLLENHGPSRTSLRYEGSNWTPLTRMDDMIMIAYNSERGRMPTSICG